MPCDFSFKAATFSKPADPGRNDLDEQKTCENGENNKKQIEIFFRHCPSVSARRQSNAETVKERVTDRREWRRLPEMSSIGQHQDALVL
jgi:hypothetical protein